MPGKKIACDVDNFPSYSEEQYKMLCQIQELLKEGCSYREIPRFISTDCRLKRPPVPYYPASVSHIIRPAINHYSTVLLT